MTKDRCTGSSTNSPALVRSVRVKDSETGEIGAADAMRLPHRLRGGLGWGAPQARQVSPQAITMGRRANACQHCGSDQGHSA